MGPRVLRQQRFEVRDGDMYTITVCIVCRWVSLRKRGEKARTGDAMSEWLGLSVGLMALARTLQ